MSVDILPTEILHIIFAKLDAKAFISCRQVSKRWKEIVDNSHECWKKLCEERFSGVNKEARSKAGLSYRDFYRSLSLWPSVSTSTMKIVQSNIRIYKYNYQILPNGILVCPIFGNMDALVYYDLKTQRLVNKIKVGFYITHFVETERMIVLVNTALQAYVLFKATKRRTYIGVLRMDSMDISTKMVVLDEDIYFITRTDELYHSTLIPDEQEICIVKTSRVCDFSHEILAAARKNFRTNFLVPGGIVNLRDNQLVRRCALNRNQYKHVNSKLERNGFKWHNADVYSYIHHFHRQIEELPKNITTYKSSLINSQGEIVMIATARKIIHLFKTYREPETREGYDKITYRAKLLKSLDMKELFPGRTHVCAEFNRNIDQMELLETVNGHKVVVSYGGLLCFIDLQHTLVEGPPKRKAVTRSVCACSKSKKAKAKRSKK